MDQQTDFTRLHTISISFFSSHLYLWLLRCSPDYTERTDSLISPCGSVLGYYMEKCPSWHFQKHWLNSSPTKTTGKNTYEAAVGRKEDSAKDCQKPHCWHTCAWIDLIRENCSSEYQIDSIFSN